MRFYTEITQIKPAGREDYVEFCSPAATLAICGQRTVDLHNAGVKTPAANRSVISEFQVNDVDRERTRRAETVREFWLEPTTQPWGNRSMLFRGPDGNTIRFFAPISDGASAAESGKKGGLKRRRLIGQDLTG
jgi:hypothetical protein